MLKTKLLFVFMVFILTVENTYGIAQQRILGAGSGAEDLFGRAVDISGDTIVIGAFGGLHDTNAPALSGNSAYIFQRENGQWNQVKKIESSIDTYFAYSVAIDGDTVVVSAPYEGLEGAVYVYDRNKGGANNWGLVKKLLPLDTTPKSSDYFGSSVAIYGNIIVVGAEWDDALFENIWDYAGSAYIFQKSGTWQLKEKIYPPGRKKRGAFGGQVAIHGSTVAIASTGEQNANISIYSLISAKATLLKQINFKTASSGIRTMALDRENLIVSGDLGGIRIYNKNKGGTGNYGLETSFTSEGPSIVDIFDGVIAAAEPHIVPPRVKIIARDMATSLWGVDRTYENPYVVNAPYGPVYGDYGISTAINNGTLVIGAPNTDVNGIELRGVAYVAETDQIESSGLAAIFLLLLND